MVFVYYNLKIYFHQTANTHPAACYSSKANELGEDKYHSHQCQILVIFNVWWVSVDQPTYSWSWSPHHRRRWRRWSTVRHLQQQRCRRLYPPGMFSLCSHPCRSRRIYQWGPHTCLHSNRDGQHSPENKNGTKNGLVAKVDHILPLV